MAAWTYSDWITQTTPALRAERLRLHIKEVSDRISESMSSAGRSINTADLRQYRLELEASLSAEEKKVGGGTSGGLVTGRIVYPE